MIVWIFAVLLLIFGISCLIVLLIATLIVLDMEKKTTKHWLYDSNYSIHKS